MVRSAVLVLVGVSGCIPASWIPAERRDPPTAQPTEVIPDSIDAKRARSKTRKAWLKARHRAGPDVDWERIERDNGRERIARRSRLAAAPPDGAPDDGDRWTERGSENQAGRTHVTRIAPDGETLYVGAAAGGVWRRDPDGTWTPLGDGLYGGAHWLEVFDGAAEGDPDVLVAGTDGGLLHRSVDGGLTWQEGTGLEWAWAQRRLAKSSDGSGTLYAVRGNSDGYTVWRSDDQAASWTEVADLGDHAGDVWVPRTGDATVWLAREEGLFRSDDRGESWVQAGAWSVVDSNELAGSEAWTEAGGAPRFWVVQNGRTLLRSDDGGVSFGAAVPVSDFWGSLATSTVDPERVVYGGVELHKSADAGASFTIQNGWGEYYDAVDTKLHADLMGIDVVPGADGTETWFANTDGGTYRSTDGLANVENLSLRGLRVSQYYTTLTSRTDPAHVAAGAQDQGYQVSTDQPATGHLYDFDQLLSGDYAHLTSGDGTHELVYSVYPGFMLIQVGETAPELTWAEFPADARSYAWLPVIVADPEDPEVVYFAGDKLWRYARQDHWTWSVAGYSEQDFQASDGEYIGALAFAPSSPQRAYAVTSHGRFFRSDDRGETWTAAADGLPGGQYFYGTALLVSAADPDTVWVGGSGYSNEPIWVSHDGGATFEAHSKGLPSTLVYSLVEEPTSGTLFAGTETSAWRLQPGASKWEDITGTEAPLVVYWSAEVVPAAGLVRFGTYGRGVWDYVYDADLDGCVDDLDADGDGSLCGDDCNDADATVLPGATDVCGDGVDQDCDGGDTTCPEDTGHGEPPPGTDTPDPCGCASAEVGAGALLLVGAWGAVRRRRQA